MASEWEIELYEEKIKRKKKLGWILYIAVVIGLSYFVITFVGVRTLVSGESMEPTLSDGDSVFLEKISYRLGEPERFDIVVFPYEYERDIYFIKRIIGIPGDTIQIKEGVVYLNDKILKKDIYGDDIMYKPGIAEFPVQLGKDEYFVLGDNRNKSKDSRDPKVGAVSREELIGRVWIRTWPLSDFGIVDHE